MEHLAHHHHPRSAPNASSLSFTAPVGATVASSGRLARFAASRRTSPGLGPRPRLRGLPLLGRCGPAPVDLVADFKLYRGPVGDGQLRIGELAQRHGLSTATLRYYERLGLLDEPERSPSGYRLYDDHHDE